MGSNINTLLASQLEKLGVPPKKHTYDGLREFLPLHLDPVKDLEVLAEIVIYLGRHGVLKPFRLQTIT